MFNLRSKITVKILGYFFVNPTKKKYINELARILSIDPGNLDRKIKELEKNGIFNSEVIGNSKYFYLNKNYPFLKELKKIYNASFGFGNILKDLLININGLKNVYIFGSFASDNLDITSDIDILLIGNHSSIEISKVIYPLQKQFEREINIINMTEKELSDRENKDDAFVKNIFNNTIITIL